MLHKLENRFKINKLKKKRLDIFMDNSSPALKAGGATRGGSG